MAIQVLKFLSISRSSFVSYCSLGAGGIYRLGIFNSRYYLPYCWVEYQACGQKLEILKRLRCRRFLLQC